VLLAFGGKSHIVYLKEQAGFTSLVVDGSNYSLEKDHDPSQLRTPSPGKLVRYLVANGDHISAGDSYAEIKVMKMYMPLVSKDSGIFTVTKLVSSVLVNGDVVGNLILDDPTAVKRAAPFTGSLPLAIYVSFFD
jgi:acetyl-CoA carboxylase/biotin carboxylase 1